MNSGSHLWKCQLKNPQFRVQLDHKQLILKIVTNLNPQVVNNLEVYHYDTKTVESYSFVQNSTNVHYADNLSDTRVDPE